MVDRKLRGQGGFEQCRRNGWDGGGKGEVAQDSQFTWKKKKGSVDQGG